MKNKTKTILGALLIVLMISIVFIPLNSVQVKALVLPGCGRAGGVVVSNGMPCQDGDTDITNQVSGLAQDDKCCKPPVDTGNQGGQPGTGAVPAVAAPVTGVVAAATGQNNNNPPPKKSDLKPGMFAQDGADILFTSISGAYAVWFTTTMMLNAGTCGVEQPRLDTSACQSCNEDPYRICTKERCQILGKCIALPIQNLTITNEARLQAGTLGYRCIPGKCEDASLVGFKSMNATLTLSNGTEEKSRTPITGNSGKIKMNLGLINWNTRLIEITVQTDQLASCRYIIDKIKSNFSEMNDFENNYFPQNPTTKDPLTQTARVILPGDLTRDENHTIYIKCTNVCGVEHNSAYDYNQVVFKFDKKPDQLPPEITFLDPSNNGAVRDDLKILNVSLWLDEDGFCAYSTKAENYSTYWDNMSKMQKGFKKDSRYAAGEDTPIIETICNYDKECRDLKLNKCAHCFMLLNLSRGYETINWTSLPIDLQNQIDQTSGFNISKMFTIKLRCQDIANNKMPEEDTLNYVIMTMPGYNINITKPEENQELYDQTPDIEVTTDSRMTQCRYKIYPREQNKLPKWDDAWLIDDSMSTFHSREHNESLTGSNLGKPYVLQAICRDQWNMEARDNVTFLILNDTHAPRLIRTYHDSINGDFLTIETDEKSSCAYSFSGCNFNYSKGSSMMGDNEYLHTTYWKDKTYFIKCQDEFGNFPTPAVDAEGGIVGTKSPIEPYCTAVLRPFDIPMIS